MPDLFCQVISRAGPEAIEEHLESLETHCHHRAIIQSNGYGKTRLCLELLRKHKGVYFICSNLQCDWDQSRWSPCQFILDFLEKLQNNPTDHDLIHRFVDKIYHTLKNSPEGSVDLFQAQFDTKSGAMNSEFYQRFCEQPLTKPPGQIFLIPPMDTPKVSKKRKHGTSSAINSHSPLALPVLSSFPATQHAPFLIVFDDSYVFDETSLSILKHYLNKYHLLGVFPSTSLHVNQMLPPNASNRGGDTLQEPLPLYFLPTTDMYKDHLFVYGRPLWYHFLWSRCQNKMRTLISFCVSRLMRSESDDMSSYSALALFMCRFGSMSLLSLNIARKYVASHLATISSLHSIISTDERGQPNREIAHELSYPSEPVLAEASCWRTSSIFPSSQSSSHEEVLDVIYRQLRFPDIVSVNKGDLPEIVGSALLGYTMDFIRVKSLQPYSYCDEVYHHLRNTFSSNVSLEEFLCSLYPEFSKTGDPGIMEFRNEIKGFVVNFTHFYKLPGSADDSVCLTAIDRHAGVLTRDYCPAIDLFVTAFKESPVPSSSSAPSERELLHVRVSIKNYESNLTDGKVSELLNLIDPTKTEPRPDCLDCPLPLAVFLLINVGGGQMNPVLRLKSETIASSPLSSASDQSQVVKQLQMALPLKHEKCFVDIPSGVRELLLKIATYREIEFQPSMKFGHDVSKDYGLQEELVW
jgi:hypothetical protein